MNQVEADHPKPVVTRFAPSPTGYLHVGGARTALFNWAYARRHNGTFILRIEDTDRARSTTESTRRIIEDLRWLGLDWDQGPDPTPGVEPHSSQIGPEGSGPYFQSQRQELYETHLRRLLECGRAYKCFKTPEQLAADREEAKRNKRAYKYDRTESIGLSADTVAQYEREGRPGVVRFRMPDTDITVNDLVLGPVTIKAQELEDFVIQKSDGSPTFHLANVVDDALMAVTHVLRAQEHLMNTPKHAALQTALGFDSPAYAHLPLIFNPDGSKMSKRDKAKAARQAGKEWQQANGGVEALLDRLGAAAPRTGETAAPARERIEAFLNKKTDEMDIVEHVSQVLNVDLPEIDVVDFHASGYLPDVLINYLCLLGWSPGNDLERFDAEFLVENFDLSRIGKANARFDRKKLLAFNSDTIAALKPRSFRERLRHHLNAYYPAYRELILDEARFTLFAEAYRERSRTLDEPARNGLFFVIDDEEVVYDPKAISKVLAKDDGAGYMILRDVYSVLEAISDWEPRSLEPAIDAFAQDLGLGVGKVAQPLRVSVSGGTVSPPIYDTLSILGMDHTLARVRRCISLSGVGMASSESDPHWI